MLVPHRDVLSVLFASCAVQWVIVHVASCCFATLGCSCVLEKCCNPPCQSFLLERFTHMCCDSENHGLFLTLNTCELAYFMYVPHPVIAR